jgi:hypothetical protein
MKLRPNFGRQSLSRSARRFAIWRSISARVSGLVMRVASAAIGLSNSDGANGRHSSGSLAKFSDGFSHGTAGAFSGLEFGSLGIAAKHSTCQSYSLRKRAYRRYLNYWT